MTTTINLVSFSDCDFSQTVNAPIDLTGAGINSYTLHMQVRTIATDPTVWLQLLSTTFGQFTVTLNTFPTPDVIAIYITQATLLNLPPGSYVYSLILSINGGALRTEVCRGSLTHNAGPTQWTEGTA